MTTYHFLISRFIINNITLELILILTLIGCDGIRRQHLNKPGLCQQDTPCLNSLNKELIPIQYKDKIKANKDLQNILKKHPETMIVTITPNYIHAMTKSNFSYPVNDIEFFFNDNSKQIHIKASSFQHSINKKVNKKVIEEIRFGFIQGELNL